jgi:hypothetical protein
VGKWKNRLAKGALALWAALMLLAGSILLGRHLLALPRPSSDDDVLSRSMATLRGTDDAHRWMAVHVLYGQCRCSQRIVEHLLSTERPSDVSEKILLVGGSADLERRLEAKGYAVTDVTATELSERYHVSGVPLLVVVAPDGAIRYTGGYTARKQGPNPADLEILDGLRADRSVASFPVFGCAVARELITELSPWRLP